MKNNLSLTLKNTLNLSLFLPKKKNLIIKNEGNYYLLRKVYIVVSEDLKYLIQSKKYLYLYYPIKKINYSIVKKYLSNINDNKYKICSNKKQIINEVKSFLGIENDCFSFKFNIYDEKLNLITNDYQLSQNIKNNINNIIYIKIVKLKNEEIKRKREKYQFNKKLNWLFIEKRNKKKYENQKLNIDEILNINKMGKNIFNNKNEISPNIGRNRKLNNDLIFIDSYCSFSKKINKNTSTDDLGTKNKNQKITNNKNINNSKYPLLNSYTSRSFTNQKRNSRNIFPEKIKNNFNNKRANLSTPDYYNTIKKKFNIKMSIKDNDLLNIPLKKTNFFNNKFINNIFSKNNFLNNEKEFMKTLSDKNIIYNSFVKETKKPLFLSPHNKFNSYFNSNINIYNQKLKEIYLDNKSLSPIKKNNNYNIRLYI